MGEKRPLRPLQFSEMFDEVFYLLRSNFILFVGIAAVVYVLPATLLGLRGIETTMFVSYLSILLQPLVTAAGTYAISKRYLGETCTIKEAYEAVFRRIVSFIFLIVVIGFITFGAAIALVFPAIVVYFWYIFAVQAFVIEGLDRKEARQRSKQLAEGHWWRIFLVFLVFGVVFNTVQQFLVLIILMLGSAVADAGIMGRVVSALAGFGYGLVVSVFMVLQLIISVLLYYDIRVRKEGFDLQLLAEELSKNAAEPTSTP